MILFLLCTFLFAFKTLSLELYPLKTGIGRYIGIQKQYDSVFLAKKKIEVIESSDDRNDTIIVCDVIPILLKGDKEVDLVTSCLKTHTEVSKNDIFSIINKDFSLYDTAYFLSLIARIYNSTHQSYSSIKSRKVAPTHGIQLCVPSFVFRGIILFLWHFFGHRNF